MQNQLYYRGKRKQSVRNVPHFQIFYQSAVPAHKLFVLLARHNVLLEAILCFQEVKKSDYTASFVALQEFCNLYFLVSFRNYLLEFGIADLKQQQRETYREKYTDTSQRRTEILSKFVLVAEPQVFDLDE